MKLLGIELRKATFNEITAAAVLGTGLWMVGLGIDQGRRHLLVNIGVIAVLLGAYDGALAFVA